MATYVLIHGAGDVASNWDLVAAELREGLHDVVAVDLPCEDETAGWSEYTDTVVEAVGERTSLVVVAHSLGGFTAPLVCERLRVDLLVLVAAMVPCPGETADEWWSNSGLAALDRPPLDEIEMFFNDLDADRAADALAKGRDQAAKPMQEPWPLGAWPAVPTRYLLCRDDRFFPADWTRQMVQQRLGITPDEIDGGHCPFLSRPRELADRLEVYRVNRCG